MLLLPGSSVRDDELETSAAQTNGEAFHLCATAHLGVSAFKHMAKRMGIDSEKRFIFIFMI
jgi:hypothetical protein